MKYYCTIKGFTLLILLVLAYHTSYAIDSLKLHPSKFFSQYNRKIYTSENGLPTNTINDILLSSRGYIWIATYDGLARYDGNRFVSFNSSTDSVFLSSSINVMFEDENNDLWLGTQGGVVKKTKHSFLRVPELSSLDFESVEKIFKDSKGILWFSTASAGLFFLEKDSKELKKAPISIAEYSFIYEDEKRVVWFGSPRGDLFTYSNGRFTKYFENAEEYSFFHMFTTSSNEVLVTMKDGIYSFNKTDRSFKLWLKDINSVHDIIEDQYGYFWIASEIGLVIYNPTKKDIRRIDESNGLPYNIIRSMISDEEGNIWLGTYRGGICHISDGLFTTFSTLEGLSSNIPVSMAELDSNSYFVATEDGVISLIQNGKTTTYPLKTSLEGMRMKSLFLDSRKRLWISCYGGLLRKDGSSEKLFNKESGLTDNSIRQVVEITPNEYWIATRNGGLCKMVNDRIVRTYGSTELGSEFIMSLDVEENNTVVVCSKNGIAKIKNDSIVYAKSTTSGLINDIVFSTLAHGSDLWVCHSEGISMIDADGRVHSVKHPRLQGESVFDIVIDSKGFFWMLLPKGILRVSSTELRINALDNSKLLNCRIYGKPDGLKDDQTIGATQIFKSSDGNLWFFTNGGVSRINPDIYEVEEYFPKMITERIWVDDVAYFLDDTNVLRLPAGVNKISIEFTMFNYNYADKFKFKFKLYPFDKDWEYSSSERHVRYTSLEPGRYEFNLTSIDNLGREHPNPEKFILIIEANWYETLYAKIAASLLILIIFYFLYRVRVRQLEGRKKVLEKVVEARTAEILEQNKRIRSQSEEMASTLENLKKAQSQLVESEKMASLGILTAGIAHEINNPMNFIYAGIEELKYLMADVDKVIDAYSKLHELSTEESLSAKLSEILALRKSLYFDDLRTDIQQMIKDVREGAERSSEIVKGLRNFSRLDEGERKLVDLQEGLESTLVLLKNLHKDKIEIRKEYLEEGCVIDCYPGPINQVFMNILSNAFQAMGDSGIVWIKVLKTEIGVEIHFKDNGPGIPEDIQSHIFEPFFTTKEVGEGSGLGLSISYSIIKNHNGDIQMFSTLGEGTTFIIFLPFIQKA